MSAERLPPIGDGLLVIDKPAGWTSHDVVARSRRFCRTRKVGHAGTLDPMATGVLVLGVGRGTKLLTFLVGSDKAYTASIRLGQETVTDDAQGEVMSTQDTSAVSESDIAAAAAALTGCIDQVPSAVSAIKVDGRRAYARVRSGEDVELAARPVTVSRFEILRTRRSTTGLLEVDIEVEVSSGTYVRALARDLGRALVVGGHLSALRRTRVGGITLAQAATLEQLDPQLGGDAAAHLVDLAQAARAAFPTRELTEPEARALGYGQRIPSAVPGRTTAVAAIGPDGRVVAMLDESGEQARPHVVLAPSGAG